MAHPITLNPGAPSEITAEPGAISIPDVWHIALELKATGARVTLLEDGEPVEKLAGDYILDCWHLAHALRRYIIDHQQRLESLEEAHRTRLAMLTGPCYCAANESHPGVCRGADCYCHGEPGPRTNDDEPADEDDDEQEAQV